MSTTDRAVEASQVPRLKRVAQHGCLVSESTCWSGKDPSTGVSQEDGEWERVSEKN